MNANASPDSTPPRFARTIAVLAALALLAGLAGAYQVGVRAKRAPSFAVGGEFANPDDFPYPGVDGRGYPYGNVLQSTTTTASVDQAPSAQATDAPVSPTPTTAAPSTTPATVDLTTPRLPATGTYSYALEGKEGATAFGERTLPARGGIVIHTAPNLRADELVHDLKLSDQHEEREIVRYTRAGIAFSFEGGAITFGPGTQTSQADYEPVMVQIPFPLQAGAKASGSSAAKTGSTVARTEDWVAKVVGQEQLDVLGQARTTWVIDLQRTTKPGGPEQVNRFRRYWYDPELGTWVKWTERFAASRDMVVDFSYSASYTATLVGFTPSK